MRFTKAILLAGLASTSMLAWSARAQTAEGRQPAETAPSDGELGLGDIVVTAQRREESLQKVPIAINAVDAGGLARAGINDTASLGSIIPGLVIGSERSTTSPYIRGIGSRNSAPGAETPVATYVDGVYIAALSGTNLSFNNIERIEVLKGPQGTLFGRNATAGLINIISRKPSFTPTVEGEAGYGNYETVSGRIYGSTGLTDTLAIDIAGVLSHQGNGFGKNVARYVAPFVPPGAAAGDPIPGVTGADAYYKREWGLRSSILFNPSDTVKFTLAGDYSHRNTDIGNSLDLLPGGAAVFGQKFDGRFAVQDELKARADFNQWGVSLVGEFDLNGISIKSTTAYRNVDDFGTFDQDHTSAPVVFAELTQLSETFQQEVLLQGETDRLNYTLGLFYFHAKSQFDPLRINSGVSAAFRSELYSQSTTDSYAAFGQVDYQISDATKVTAGLRFTRDQQELDGETRDFNGNILQTTDNNPTRPVSPAFPDGAFSNTAKFNKLTWRGAIDHQLTDNVLLYASISRGFKSGAYNLASPYTAPARPETLDAYEVGFKSDLLDRTLRLNANAFYYDYKDFQTNRAIPGGSMIYNAGKARIYGIEIDAVIAPPMKHGDLQIRLATSLMSAKYASFPTATSVVITPIPGGACNRNALTPSFTCTYDARGNRLSNAPDFTLNAGFDYIIPIGDHKLGLAANYAFKSDLYFDPSNVRLSRQKAYGLLNGRITWTLPDDRWSLALWGNNLTDVVYASRNNQAGLGDVVLYGNPRTYGATIGFKFGR